MSQNTRLAGEVEQLSLQCETLRAEKDQWNREKDQWNREKDQCNGEKEGRWISWLYVLKEDCDMLLMLQAWQLK